MVDRQKGETIRIYGARYVTITKLSIMNKSTPSAWGIGDNRPWDMSSEIVIIIARERETLEMK